MQQGQPRVAVIGAGPSGLYAAAALLASGAGISVDVLDRLPAPYGLVRYGVAPDHVKMKSVIRVLQRPFDPAEVHFLGNVRVGDGPGEPGGAEGDGAAGTVPLDVLREHYHAIVHATGSSIDRDLGATMSSSTSGPACSPSSAWTTRSRAPDRTNRPPPSPEHVVPDQGPLTRPRKRPRE